MKSLFVTVLLAAAVNAQDRQEETENC